MVQVVDAVMGCLSGLADVDVALRVASMAFHIATVASVYAMVKLARDLTRRLPDWQALRAVYRACWYAALCWMAALVVRGGAAVVMGGASPVEVVCAGAVAAASVVAACALYKARPLVARLFGLMETRCE